MQKTFLASLFAFTAIFSVTPARAQQPQQDPRQRVEQLAGRLKLTPDQKEKVVPIFAEEMRQLQELRQQNQGSDSRRGRRKMAREFKDIRAETDKKLKNVLSADQMAELKKIREERREQMRSRRQQSLQGA